MDNYQAVYDAVRSRISNGDIGQAVGDAVREANIGHYVEMAFEAVRSAASEHQRPSTMMRPKLYKDGDQWCALYGDDVQSGVTGFGESPQQAMWEFDAAWYADIKTTSTGG